MSIFTLYFIAGQLVWGFLPIFWKLLAALDPLYLLAARIVFSALLCGVYILFSQYRRECAALFHDRPMLLRLVWSSLFITMNWGLYIMAVTGGHIFEASLAYFINPIICLLFSSLIFREAMNTWQKGAACVSGAGILLSFLLYGDIPWLSLALCFPFAVYSAIKKKMKMSGMVSVFMESAYMVVPSLAYMGWCEAAGQGAEQALAGWEWGLLPMTGILTALPMALFSAGLRGISFSAASILMYMSPTIQIFLAAFYGESLSPIMLINFAFVLTAVVLYITGTLKKGKAIQRKVHQANDCRT